MPPPPKDVWVLILRAYEHYLTGQKDLCRCGEVKDLEMGALILDQLGGPDIVAWVLTRSRHRESDCRQTEPVM